MFKRYGIVGAGLMLAFCATAQTGVLDPSSPEFRHAVGGDAVHSRSDQFLVVRGADSSSAVPEAVLHAASADEHVMTLDPVRLAISAEKIKAVLLSELGVGDHWAGRIHLELMPSHNPDARIFVEREFLAGACEYRVYLPGKIDSSRLVITMVKVLLDEMVHRNSAGPDIDVPLWLSEGLAQEVIHSRDIAVPQTLTMALRTNWTVVSSMLADLDPPVLDGAAYEPGTSFVTTYSGIGTNSLTQAHEILRSAKALGLDQLAWPTEQQQWGEPDPVYRASAQLLVSRLLEFNDGPVCMRAFVESLPHHLNWQAAFFQAFHSRFASERDLEKWWSLETITFTGRDLTKTWPAGESLAKLAEALRTPVEVRLATNSLPMHSDVSLQTIVRDWEFSQQTEVLNRKISLLRLFHYQVSPEIAGLVDDYRTTLDSYVKDRAKNVATYNSLPLAQRVADETARQLNALDARRALLERGVQPEITAIPAGSPVQTAARR